MEGNALASPCISVCGKCFLSKKLAIVGTKVRDRMNENVIESITAIAMGTNKNLDTPSKKNMGTKTIHMQSKETKAGVTI